jgi:uncharacterized repeat protein (TIGR01451 family)
MNVKNLYRFLFGILTNIVFVSSTYAQSACTALWGVTNAGGTITLRYFNTATNSWVSPGLTALANNPNALTGNSTNGLLYYVERTTGNFRSINLNTGVNTLISTITAGFPAGTTANDIVGATYTAGNRHILYLTDNAAPQGAYVAEINPATGAFIIGWTKVLTTAGANPTFGGSGDIYTNQAGLSYIATNSTPSLIHAVNLTAGASFGRTSSPSVSITAGPLPNLAGIAVNPVGGNAYIGTGSPGAVTYSLSQTPTWAVSLIDNTTSYTIADMGNCVTAPLSPSITKSFTPTYLSASGTTTLNISITNSNSAPVWLLSALVDNLPAGMVVASPPNLNTGACAASATITNVITATAGQTSVTFASGGRIPAGGCTISVNVSATAAVTPYTNTIAAAALATTAGSNPAVATATLKVGTDFSMLKQQRIGTVNPLQTTPLSMLAGDTVQYVLTIANSNTGGTGSVSFTDTLPIEITPVLSITATQTGGGTCTTASAVVTGRTQVTGNIVNAPAGSTCTITITALVAGTVTTATNITNTASVAPAAGTTDTNATNNQSTATATITPAVNLSVTKTNSTGAIGAGTTTTYTVTFANAGPGNGVNSVAKDTPSSGLSNCTVLSCSSTGVATATCPATIGNLLIPAGAVIPNMPANSALTFSVRCAVNATGQ